MSRQATSLCLVVVAARKAPGMLPLYGNGLLAQVVVANIAHFTTRYGVAGSRAPFSFVARFTVQCYTGSLV